jgi:hypothetical protein
MKRTCRTLAVAIVATALFFALDFHPDTIFGQTTEPQKKTETLKDTSKDGSIPMTLRTLIWSWEEIERELNEKKQVAKSVATPEEKDAINLQINALNLKMSKLKDDFENLATGIDLSNFDEEHINTFSWKDESLKLIRPLMLELNRMTARPRQIEQLRRQIEYLENRLAAIERGLKHLQNLLKGLNITNKVLLKQLEKLNETYLNDKTQLEDQLTVDRFKLTELLNQRESFWQAGHYVFKSFFKNRGRNFILSILIFFVVFFIMRIFRRLIHRYSPIHQEKKRTFFIRLSDVIYHIITVAGSTSALLAVLYMAGDWLLLSFMIIILIGIALSAKAGLPRGWKQIQLMLNLGTVREGERIIYNGVPWKVASLSLNSKLENPLLEPDTVRVRLTELFNANSRKYHPNEPWFPSKIGDWVILADRTRGQVFSQTSEMVQLILRGGSRKTYLTQDYLGLSPHNLSADFRIKVVFGFDYKHQSVITEEIPAQLTVALKQGFAQKGYADVILQLKTEVQSAGDSSINLVVIADFAGQTAAYYNRFKRIIQTLTIQACTANNWGIPFPQLTLHRADSKTSEA